MKAIKYFVVGAFVACANVPVMAQDVDYKAVLAPIAKELKANPSSPELEKSAKAYAKTFKKDPEALVALGNAYLSAKNYAKAVQFADLALAKAKNYGDAYVLKGDAAAMQDEGGEAAMWYQQAMTQDPQNPNGYMSYANVYRKRSPEEADRALKALRENIPGFPVEAEAAHSYYSAGNYAKAMEYWKQSNIEKLEESHLLEYALTALSVNDKEAALKVSKQGINKYSENISFVRLALVSTIGLEEYDDALGYAKTLIAKEGDKNAGDIAYYGQALAGTGQYEEALAQYNKALSLDKQNFKPYQYISEVYAKQGNEDKALEYSQKYLSLDPNAKISDYNKLAEIYLAKVKKGENSEANFAKAMEVYDNLAAKYPQIASWTRYQKANQAYQLEMDDKALGLYKQVIAELEAKADRDADETSYLATSYRNLGYIYWSSKKDLKSARPYFEKLLVIDPSNSLANKAKEAWTEDDDENED